MIFWKKLMIFWIRKTVDIHGVNTLIIKRIKIVKEDQNNLDSICGDIKQGFGIHQEQRF